MSDQIPFDQRAVSHVKLFTCAFGTFVYVPISKGCIFSSNLFRFSYKSACEIFPVGKISWVDLSAGKEFAENVNQVRFEFFIKRFSRFRISIVQTVVNSLRNDVIELLEKLLFRLRILIFITCIVLNQLKWNKVGSNAIKQKLLVLLEFRLWVH